MYNPYSLVGKTILITGASSGIGRATAIECSRLGATVILTARNKTRLEDTLSLLDNQDNNHMIVEADLSSEEGISQLINASPLLDGIVNNAGVGVTLPIQFISTEKLEELFRVNCFAPILLTKGLLKKKKVNKCASIVFTASIAGTSNINPGNAIYGSSKSALHAYVKYAALELSSKLIRCNAVSPGSVETPLIENRFLSENDVKADINRYPLKRYANPQEVALTISFLLSDASSYITGTNITIDGGRSLV